MCSMKLHKLICESQKGVAHIIIHDIKDNALPALSRLFKFLIFTVKMEVGWGMVFLLMMT